MNLVNILSLTRTEPHLLPSPYILLLQQRLCDDDVSGLQVSMKTQSSCPRVLDLFERFSFPSAQLPKKMDIGLLGDGLGK